jgi:hypothetical protein
MFRGAKYTIPPHPAGANRAGRRDNRHMFSRDYILRLIEQLARTLIALRNRILRQESGESESLAEINAIAQQAGLDLDVARRLDPASLLVWLAPFRDSDPGRLWLMAELLYLAAQASASDSVGDADLKRARAIYERLPPDWRPSPDLPAAGDRLTEIRGLLEAHPHRR